VGLLLFGEIMPLFKDLLPLLRQRTVLMTVAALDDGNLRVNIIPRQTGESENKALCTPLSVTGTAEELDAELPKAIVEFVAAHLTLKDSLAQTKAEMDAADKAAKEDAKNKQKTLNKGKTTATATTKPTEPTKPEPPKPAAPPSLFDAPSALTPEAKLAAEPQATSPAAPAASETSAAPPVAVMPSPSSGASPEPLTAATEDDEDETETDDQAEADAAYQATKGNQQEQLLIA
jgi:PRTRC genetic system protein E